MPGRSCSRALSRISNSCGYPVTGKPVTSWFMLVLRLWQLTTGVLPGNPGAHRHPPSLPVRHREIRVLSLQGMHSPGKRPVQETSY